MLWFLNCITSKSKDFCQEVLITFDGWTSKYDYWCKTDAPEIHPIGYTAHNAIKLQEPKGNIIFVCQHVLS